MSSDQLRKDSPGGNFLAEYAAENFNLHNKSSSNDLEKQQLRNRNSVQQQYETSHQVYTGIRQAAFRNTEQSFNDVRDNYAEQAMNSPPESGTPMQVQELQHYDYEKNSGSDPHGSFSCTENLGRIPDAVRSRTGRAEPFYNKAHIKAGVSEVYRKKLDKADDRLKQTNQKIEKLENRKDRRLRFSYGRIIYEVV